MKNLLLDTHALLWYIEGNEHLPYSLREELSNAQLWISAVSLWEITIKVSLGKLEVSPNLPDFLRRLKKLDFKHIAITDEQLVTLQGLPFHHRDPFDRLLIAQAITQNIPLVSKDRVFKEYSVEVLWS